MNKKETLPTLKTNFSWTLFGNIIYSISQFGILMVLAKMGDPRIVGHFTLALAITAPIFLFFYFKLRSVQATDQANEYAFNEYYSLRTIMSIAVMFIIICILFITNYNLEVKLIIFFVSCSKFFDAQSDIIYGLMQKKEEMHLIAKSMILKGTLSLLFISITYYLTGNLIISVLFMFISSLMVFICYDMPKAKKFIPNYKMQFKLTKNLVKLLTISFPLGITVLLGSLNTNIPRYFIEYFSGDYELGIFAGISFLLIASGTLINSLGQAVTPRLASYYQENKISLFYNLIFKLTISGLVLGIVGFVFIYFLGREVLTIIYTAEYANYNNVFMIIMGGAILLYSTVFLGTGLTAMRKFKVQLPIHILSFIVVIISSMLLIPSFGIIGGAIVIFLGNLISSIGYLFIFFVFKYREDKENENGTRGF